MRNKSYTYVEKSVGLEDGGEYECVAENRFGKASVKFNVILKGESYFCIFNNLKYIFLLRGKVFLAQVVLSLLS